METKKYFSLLGFSPEMQSQLQSLISKKIGDQIVWVSAVDKDIEGVIINATFASSPQIQKFVKESPAKIVYCCNDSETEANYFDEKAPILNLSGYSAEKLKYWLSFLMNNPMLETLTEEESVVSNQALEKNNSNTTNSDNSETEKELSNDYKTLLSNLQQDKGFYLIKTGRRHTWIDVANKQAYLDFERDRIPFFEKVSWKELDTFEVPKEAKRLQLELWLFQSLWLSRDKNLVNIDESTRYKLTRWPRPLHDKGRTEALRLAAFVQTGATASELSKKTGYDIEITKRFINAALITGQVIETDKDTNVTVIDNAANTHKNQEKLGLINRIRKKLSL